MARDDLSEVAALAADPELLEEAARLHTLEADVALWLEHDTVGGQGAAAIGLAMARRLAEVAGGVGALLPSHRAAYLRALESAMDAALQADRGAEVVELGDETLRVAERGGSDARAAALNRVAFAMASIGLVRDAARLYGEAWDLANDLVLPSAAVDAGHGLASALHQVGPVPRAREMALATMDLESRLRNAPRRWGHAGPALHNIELSLGEPVAALRFLREDAAHEADPHFRLGIHQTIALWEARLGGPGAAARASAELDAATSDWALVRCPRCGRELGIHAVEVRARIGEVEEARRALAAWDAEVPTPGFGAQRWRQTAEAMLRAGEGDVAAATDGLRDSATEATAGGRISDATWAWLDAGRLLAETDRRAAIEALSQAATLGEQAGLVTQVRLASLLLRRLGVRAWRRGASGGVDRLSEREAEIARLVASGASNREIAETLLIAPKTVERHVSNALTKLGLRNRTELAGLVRSDASVRVPPDDRQTGPT
jgi:DNA-binding CsgD family transcriptional regulator